MKTKILITLCFALSFCVEVYGEGEQEVKRGLFPFMAFLYYPDETVVDGTGARFLRGAVLIRSDWLVTSAVGPSILTNGPKGFPRKTLLARLGAIAIDSNFTLNEDEEEQEREVIQIVRPYNHSATQWWHTDISLMKTLLPFNLTSAVSITVPGHKPEYLEKTCTILVFAKKVGNWTEDRNLMQLTVELLPPSVENCGHHFLGKTMICAADSDENKNAVYDPNFCQGNSGGPLICEGDFIGIQTYIDNDCQQPHLYQLLSAWDNFISCGTEDKCQEEQCSKICDVANKDPPVIDNSDDRETADKTAKDVVAAKVTSTSEIDVTTIYATYDTTIDSEGLTPTMTPEDQTTVDQTNVEQTTGDQIAGDQTPEDQTTVDQPTMTERSIVTYPPSSESQTSVKEDAKEETTETKSWPKEKYPEARKSMEQGDLEDPNRKPTVEAQQQNVKVKAHNVGQTNILNHSFFFGFYILACLI